MAELAVCKNLLLFTTNITCLPYFLSRPRQARVSFNHAILHQGFFAGLFLEAGGPLRKTPEEYFNSMCRVGEWKEKGKCKSFALKKNPEVTANNLPNQQNQNQQLGPPRNLDAKNTRIWTKNDFRRMETNKSSKTAKHSVVLHKK